MDHVQIVTDDFEKFDVYLRALGFSELFPHKDHYEGGTGMEGAIYSRGAGRVNVSLLQGIDTEDEKSQLTEYTNRFGPFCVQHLAMEVKDVFNTMYRMMDRGVKFVTPVVESEDNSGTIRQAFTYPVAPGGPFFELVERNVTDAKAVTRIHEKPCSITYSENSVHTLYNCIQQAIRDGWWFKVDLFGNVYE